MTLNITKMTDESIILIEVAKPVAYPDDPIAATKAAMEFLEEQGGTICRITDFSAIQSTFSEMVEGMAADKSFSNPKIRNVVIATDAIIKLGAQSWKQDQYGGVDVKIVTTKADALREARALMKDV